MVTSLIVLVLLWSAGRAALRWEGRQPPNGLAPLLAPFGRVCTLPAGTQVLTAKKWYFREYELPEAMRIWAGWWNCRRFDPDSDRYYFIEGPSRYAVPVAATLATRELAS
jgi:hypothetical protein